MKVGIVTLNGNHNYGNRLQLYACNSLFKSLGMEPTVLIPREGMLQQRNVSWRLKHRLKGVLRKSDCADVEEAMNPLRLRAFEKFSLMANSRVIDYDDLNVIALQYDYFSVGSDQVWNPDFIRYQERWFYLKFAKPKQRIALSPSIGLNKLGPIQAKRLRWGLEGFAHISVREKRGAEIIKEVCGRDALVTIDPTLAIAPKEWRYVANDSLTPSTPYIFAYLLGTPGEKTAHFLDALSKEWDIPIVSLGDGEGEGELPAGPAEFIDLIDNATHVVTDSFHAAVFSALMETPVTIVRREGGADIFSRLDSLTKMLKIENRILGSASFDFDKAGEYHGVSEIIERERMVLLEYLQECLNA